MGDCELLKYRFVIDGVKYFFMYPKGQTPNVVMIPDGRLFSTFDWERGLIDNSMMTNKIQPLQPEPSISNQKVVQAEEDGPHLYAESHTPEAASLLDGFLSGDRNAITQLLGCSNPHALFVSDMPGNLAKLETNAQPLTRKFCSFDGPNGWGDVYYVCQNLSIYYWLVRGTCDQRFVQDEIVKQISKEMSINYKDYAWFSLDNPVPKFCMGSYRLQFSDLGKEPHVIALGIERVSDEIKDVLFDKKQ